MNDSVLIVLVVGALVILAVIAYNMYQENQYRKQLRDQFGHANKDALLDSDVDSVRDNGIADQQASAVPIKPFRETNLADLKPPVALKDEGVVEVGDAIEPVVECESVDILRERQNTQEEIEPVAEMTAAILQPEVEPERAGSLFQFNKLKAKLPSQSVPRGDRRPLLNVRDMAKQPLPWFDNRFDYLAYVSLYEPKELHAMPRLSSRHRFRIVGCTMDDRFQVAEPIPSVYYQGFVVGLQAISRTGLASQEELEHFGEQANKFAEQMDGELLLTDVDMFLDVARPLDELCARVDQTIAIHLVSRSNISGTELRAAVERQGFELAHDGAFYFNNDKGDPLFSIVTLDNTPFTSTLLSNQNYRGFSMLFDVVHVPNGEKTFNQFMDMAVKLSSQLGLDLVNDKVEELSTQWLKEVRRYVVDRQHEMKQVDIEPGSDLAHRLFS